MKVEKMKTEPPGIKILRIISYFNKIRDEINKNEFSSMHTASQNQVQKTISTFNKYTQ